MEYTTIRVRKHLVEKLEKVKDKLKEKYPDIIIPILSYDSVIDSLINFYEKKEETKQKKPKNANSNKNKSLD